MSNSSNYGFLKRTCTDNWIKMHSFISDVIKIFSFVILFKNIPQIFRNILKLHLPYSLVCILLWCKYTTALSAPQRCKVMVVSERLLMKREWESSLADLDIQTRIYCSGSLRQFHQKPIGSCCLPPPPTITITTTFTTINHIRGADLSDGQRQMKEASGGSTPTYRNTALHHRAFINGAFAERNLQRI